MAEHPGQDDAPELPAAEVAAVFRHLFLQPVLWQAGQFQGRVHPADLHGLPQGDVVQERILKDLRVLGNDAQGPEQLPGGNVLQFPAGKADGTFVVPVLFGQHLQQGALACAVAADNQVFPAGGEGSAEIPDDGLPVDCDAQVLHVQAAVCLRRGFSCFGFFRGIAGDEFRDALPVGFGCRVFLPDAGNLVDGGDDLFKEQHDGQGGADSEFPVHHHDGDDGQGDDLQQGGEETVDPFHKNLIPGLVLFRPVAFHQRVLNPAGGVADAAVDLQGSDGVQEAQQDPVDGFVAFGEGHHEFPHGGQQQLVHNEQHGEAARDDGDGQPGYREGIGQGDGEGHQHADEFPVVAEIPVDDEVDFRAEYVDQGSGGDPGPQRGAEHVVFQLLPDLADIFRFQAHLQQAEEHDSCQQGQARQAQAFPSGEAQEGLAGGRVIVQDPAGRDGHQGGEGAVQGAGENQEAQAAAVVPDILFHARSPSSSCPK